MFVNLKGELNRSTICQFEREVNYLLYKQGMYYYVFDFKDVGVVDKAPKLEGRSMMLMINPKNNNN